jgi:riboflavin kinase
VAKLTIEAYPGTLNLEIEGDDLQIFQTLKTGQGIEMTPEDHAFCSAKCYPVLIAGRIKGAIVFPLVPDYPENKMELIAPVHVRENLCLEVGDLVEVEIL